MAPGVVPATGLCESVEDKVGNVFEGPEKKLVVQFALNVDSSNPTQSALGYRKNCNAACRSMCKPCPCRTLRGLRTDQIKTILNAARCTMLSVVSNVTTDAYLLSESSMFVTDFRITLKTCGTTSLLRALPVILRLAFEALDLEVLYVQFSRVAYIFPGAQIYPHDCFDHEVAYLDHHLAAKGSVFEAASHTGSEWYLYFARLHQSREKSWSPSLNPRCMISSSESSWNARSDRTLEMYMFDLDPHVMKRFMFHDRPYMIGSDNVRSGTTSQEIKSLLGDHDVVDGYNFAPCGYSMNALKHDSYYTIHVSPERGASYVSFETTAHIRSFASLVAAVVKLFRPGRFTVSYLLLGIGQSLPEVTSKVAWGLVSRLLSAEYSMIREPDVHNAEGAGCFASVGSFQKVTLRSMVEKNRVGGFCNHDGLERLLLSVAVKHNAYLGGASVLEQSSDQGFENEDDYVPKYVVNLGRVARNWSALRAVRPKKTFRLRYAVRSNTDKGVLALLNGLDVDFEAIDACEVDLLASLGVSRARIALVTPVLTTALIERFPLVGTVALFDIPAKAIHAALLRSNVGIEFRVVDDNGLQDLHATLGRLVKGSLKVTAVALDTGPDSLYKANFDKYDLSQYFINVRHSIESTLPTVRGDLVLHFGELWNPQIYSFTNAGLPTFESFFDRLPTDGVVSIDASRALLADSISLFTRVVGRRGRRMSSDPLARSPGCVSYSYYLSDGAYGALSYILMSPFERGPLMNALRPCSHSVSPTNKRKDSHSKQQHISSATKSTRKEDRYGATVYGPTCDALDCIWEGDLPVLDVGDSLLFRDIGAYSSVSRTEFNGFARRFDVSYVVAVADV